MQLGDMQDDVQDATREAIALVDRIWKRDFTVWGEHPEEIADRLGWLEADERSASSMPVLRALASSLIADGITDAVVIGMGGSSLYPEVLATTFSPARNHPRLHVLDSTDPAAVLALEDLLPWETTVVIPASKSGTTIEMACLLERFLARLREVHGEGASSFVVPVTDPDSGLATRAQTDGFRDVVLGEPDVGGRFSALTPFGNFPAALLGIDLPTYLNAARDQLVVARSSDAQLNSAAVLGAVLAVAHRVGRDKLTLLLPESIASFGLWIEQLVAESTGKHGAGLVPLTDGDADPRRYGGDRLVVALGSHDRVPELVRSGVPVVELPWSGVEQLTGEVVRWEFATAIAGALIGINPFDQPDVEAAKNATRKILETEEVLPDPEPADELLESLVEGDYIAILAFVTPGGPDHAAVERAAERLRHHYGLPVTVGVGPRYLHSTGQLHKGGPSTGAFLVVVGDDPIDAEIPTRSMTFSQLKRAQAAGDMKALKDAGRRVQRVSLNALDAIASS